MAKPKAPAWLREAFRDGVDERIGLRGVPECWLAQHDPARRPCSGRLERFHFIGRQRVENALGALLPAEWGDDDFVPVGEPLLRFELILLAAWDPRNGGIACEHHHRRFDNHATPGLIVPRAALPAHLEEFATDWGLGHELERKFP